MHVDIFTCQHAIFSHQSPYVLTKTRRMSLSSYIYIYICAYGSSSLFSLAFLSLLHVCTTCLYYIVSLTLRSLSLSLSLSLPLPLSFSLSLALALARSLPLSLSQGRGKQAVVVPARQGEREPEAAKSRQSGQEILGVSSYLSPSP